MLKPWCNYDILPTNTVPLLGFVIKIYMLDKVAVKQYSETILKMLEHSQGNTHDRVWYK